MSDVHMAVTDSRPRLTVRSWIEGIVVGGTVGFFILGIGGRLAMHAIALQERPAAGFTFEGTLTVVLLGVVSGIAGGLIHILLYRFLQHPHWLRRTLYATLLLLITLRGLRPANTLSLSLFLPLITVYGVIVAGLLERQERAKAQSRVDGQAVS